MKCQYGYGQVATGTMIVYLDPKDYVFKVGIAGNNLTGQPGKWEVAQYDGEGTDFPPKRGSARTFLGVTEAMFRGGFDGVTDAADYAAHLNRTD